MALRRPVKAAALAALILLVAGPEAAAQVDSVRAKADRACDEVIMAKGLEGEGGGCLVLAGSMVDTLTSLRYGPAPRDVQSDATGAATAGSLAQSEPVPGVQPLGVGGASIAAVGSDSGAKAIVALTVNPAIFFASLNDTEEAARATRIADLTVLFPVDDLDRDEDGRVDYFGARLRLNFTGARAGSEVLERAGAALLQLAQKETDLALKLDTVLASAPNAGNCYDALLAEEIDDALVASQCGTPFAIEVDDQRYESFRRQMADVRAEADSRYFGLDLRFDFGDPTLGAVANARATSIDAGLAWGRRFLGADPMGPSLGLKARGGARYTHLDDIEETSYAFDGAIGVEGRRPLERGQAITASAGFELRYGGADAVEDELQTNFTVFRAALAVPLAGMTGITVAVTAPIDGPISPALSVNFDWGLLLPKK
jgi:hypothetical protein